jgi:hypothetical protein
MGLRKQLSLALRERWQPKVDGEGYGFAEASRFFVKKRGKKLQTLCLRRQYCFADPIRKVFAKLFSKSEKTGGSGAKPLT